jgi:hypothetical protein
MIFSCRLAILILVYKLVKISERNVFRRISTVKANWLCPHLEADGMELKSYCNSRLPWAI